MRLTQHNTSNESDLTIFDLETGSVFIEID